MTIKFEPNYDEDRNNLGGPAGPGEIHHQKAEWHRKRAGKLRNATIKSVGKHSYAAALLDQGVGHTHSDHPEHGEHSITEHDYAFNPN